MLLILLPYHIIAHYLKWIAIVLFAYMAAALMINQPWRQIAINLFLPHVSWNREYLQMIVAIFGTTISPYLFFWQASEEVEEERFSLRHRDDICRTHYKANEVCSQSLGRSTLRRVMPERADSNLSPMLISPFFPLS